MRKQEIEENVELFVNSIYDNGNESGWMKATYQQWLEAVYEECANYVIYDLSGWSISCRNNAHRFEGKENLLNQIRPILTKRLQELKEEGYEIKAL